VLHVGAMGAAEVILVGKPIS